MNIFLTINASHSLFRSDLGLIVKMVRITKMIESNSKHETRLLELGREPFANL